MKDLTKSLCLSSLLVLQTSPGLYAQEPAPKPAVPAAVTTASTAAPGPTVAADAPNGKLVLSEGTDVPLTFDQDLSSKTAAEGDAVEFVLAEDLKVGEHKVHLRGSKGKEGASGTGAAVALTVLFGPIGLIKHGKNIEIKKGTALKVYVSDDTSLPPAV